jgi:hypothetical protein
LMMLKRLRRPHYQLPWSQHRPHWGCWQWQPVMQSSTTASVTRAPPQLPAAPVTTQAQLGVLVVAASHVHHGIGGFTKDSTALLKFSSMTVGSRQMRVGDDSGGQL